MLTVVGGHLMYQFGQQLLSLCCWVARREISTYVIWMLCGAGSRGAGSRGFELREMNGQQGQGSTKDGDREKFMFSSFRRMIPIIKMDCFNRFLISFLASLALAAPIPVRSRDNEEPALSELVRLAFGKRRPFMKANAP
ncbi:hypothetical protein N7471_000987 [Penicillium samsonianum]|uniref:uncharacterized protein n=1 Tax=Penicillium samsonianum TaxID=1882272 RepID=UPI002548F1B3|nr:uncharacterized protein N7471_000987 [Penicillium samsonianum]KAJ6149788.1 hypothetical protein N7471_000987 [Penicillium samsonianum]